MCTPCERHEALARLRSEALSLEAAEQREQPEFGPECEASGKLVDYVDWKAREHRFRFASTRYATAFVLVNRQAKKTILAADLSNDLIPDRYPMPRPTPAWEAPDREYMDSVIELREPPIKHRPSDPIDPQPPPPMPLEVALSLYPAQQTTAGLPLPAGYNPPASAAPQPPVTPAARKTTGLWLVAGILLLAGGCLATILLTNSEPTRPALAPTVAAPAPSNAPATPVAPTHEPVRHHRPRRPPVEPQRDIDTGEIIHPTPLGLSDSATGAAEERHRHRRRRR